MSFDRRRDRGASRAMSVRSPS